MADLDCGVALRRQARNVKLTPRQGQQTACALPARAGISRKTARIGANRFLSNLQIAVELPGFGLRAASPGRGSAAHRITGSDSRTGTRIGFVFPLRAHHTLRHAWERRVGNYLGRAVVDGVQHRTWALDECLPLRVLGDDACPPPADPPRPRARFTPLPSHGLKKRPRWAKSRAAVAVLVRAGRMGRGYWNSPPDVLPYRPRTIQATCRPDGRASSRIRHAPAPPHGGESPSAPAETLGPSCQ